MTLQEKKELIFQKVEVATQKAHRQPHSVTVVAVTKYVDSSIVTELVETGVSHIGENRVDKFLERYHQLSDKGLTWHLIGSLQRRKVKDVINYVDYFHALDSLALAAEIEKRAEKTINCFLQVNISGEESKHGFRPDQVSEAIDKLASFEKIKLVGLMTMAPQGASASELHHLFEQAQQLQRDLQKRQLEQMPFTELSMGMSNDFEIAIEHGATVVRIGTAFFK